MQNHPIFQTPAFDKLKFASRLRISRSLHKDHEAFARNTELPLRSIKPHFQGFSGSAMGFSTDLLTYGGTKLRISPPAADGLSDVKVEFNPGKVLYGHNGRGASYDEFLDAASIYIIHAKCLLEDPDDWPDLFPGLREGGPGRWKLLELASHFNDPVGFILAALRHLRHPSITTPARHWPDSIELGGKRANLRFSIYRKAVEMLKRGKLPPELLPVYADVLRLEVRLQGKKLVKYIGNGDNVELIDGKERVVRFLPDYITRGRSSAFSELENVWHSDEVREFSDRCQLAPLGNLIAQVASDPRCRHSFPDLLRHIAHYCRVDSKRDTLRAIREAGAGELARRSTLSFDSLFSDAAISAQPSIVIPEIERKVSHPLEDIRREPLLEAAYLPPGHVSSRRDPFPPYCH